LSRQSPALPASIDETLSLLSGASYVGDRALATVIFLSLRLGRPLFLEGEAGVGKTEDAKVLQASLIAPICSRLRGPRYRERSL
jgi:MoxR-like ATPase